MDSMGIFQQSQLNLNINIRPSIDFDDTLLKKSVSSHFKYAEQLLEYRIEFDKKRSAIKPSPHIQKMDFHSMPILGIGRFGTVRLMKMENGQYCALKILLKETVVKEGVVEKTKTERIILESVNFPFIISMLFSSKDNDFLYIGLPFAGGSDLFTYHRTRLRFSEPMARFYSSQILLALEYLHNVKCLYRDLKLENILIRSNGYVQLTDFGLSKFVESRATTLCGTPEYLAPEMLLIQPYGFSVDWWTFGVLIFELVAGNTPFSKYSDNLNQMYSKICEGQFQIPSFFSPDLGNLIQGLLDTRVATRLGNLCNGTSDIKCHNFFRAVNWRGLLTQNIPAPFIPRLLSESDTTYFTKIPSSKAPPGNRRSDIDLYADLFEDF